MPKKVTLKEFGKHIQDVYGIPEGKFELEQIARDYVNKHPSYKDRVDWLSAERERMRPREITPTDKVPAAPQHIQERFKPKQPVEETIAQPVKPTTKEPTEQPKPIAKEQAGIPASPERYQRMEGKPSIPGVSPLSTKDQIIRMHGWDQEIGELVAQRDDLEKNRRSIESQINQWAEKSITSKPMRVFGEPAEKYENRLFQDLRAANEQIDGKGGINEQIQVIHNRSQKLADKLDEAKETLRDASMEEIFAVYDLYGRDVDITTAGEVIKYTREKTELVGKINDIDSQIADLLEKTKGQRKDRLLIHSKIHTLQEQRNNTLEQIEKIKSELKVRTPAYIEELELQQQEMYGKRLVEAQNKRDIGAAIHDFTFRGVAKPLSYIEAGLGIDLAKPLADATKEFVKGINSGLIHTEKSYHGMLAMFEEDPIKRDQHLLKAQRAQKAGDVFAIKQPQFTEVQSAEDFGQWLGGSVGNLLPIVSQYMLAAKVGGIAGAKVGALGGPKGAMIGGLIGSSAASATHGWLSYGGDMFSDLSAMGIEYSEAKRIASQQAIPASLFSIAVPTGLTQVSMGFWKSVGGREFARNKFKSYIKMGLMAGPAEATGEALAQTWGVMRAFERADLETYTWNDYFKGGVDAGAPAFLMPFTTGIMGVGLKPSAVAEAETRLQHVNVTQKEKQSLQAFIKDAYDKQLDENVNLYTDLIETVEGQSDRPFARRFLIDDMKKLKEQGRLDNELESMLDWLEDFELKSETRTDKRKEISELNDALNFLDETAFKVRNRTDEQNTQAMMDLAEKNEKDILDYHEAVEVMAIYTNKPKIFVEVYKQIIEKRNLAKAIEFNKGDFLVNQYTYQGEGENDGMVVKGMTMREGQEVTIMVVNEKGDLLAVRYPDTEEVEFKPRRDVEITETVPRQDEIDMVNEQIAQQEAVEQAETLETAGMVEDLGLAGAQQIQPGMVVRHKGREGVVEEKFNPDWGLLVRMGDETFRVPVEEIGMVEMVKDQEAQVETPSPTLVLEDQEYRLNPIADNVWSVLEIGDAKQAETIVSGLAAKYPNLVFEVHNRTDLTNPFAEANYEITAKTREAAEVVAETEEAPVKETPVETQAEAPIETPEGIPAKWGDEDVLIVEGDPSVDDTVTILKDGERQDIFSNEITVESPVEAEAPAEAPIETTPEEKGVIDLTKKRPRGKLLSNLQKQASDYEPSTPFEAALQYFIAGNHAFYEKDNPKSALHQLFGTKVGDPRTQRKVESERKPRFIWMSKKGKTIDEIAHYLWETYPDISEDSQDFRIAVEDVIKDFNSPQQMAIHMVKSRDVDAAMDEYGKVKQEYMEQFDEESLQEQGETVEREGEEIASELIPQHIINTLERENITLDNVHKLEWLFDKQEDYENVKEYLRQRLADEEDTRVPEAERPDREGERVETEAAQEVTLAEKEVEKTPSEAQKEAGNYRKGHVSVQGMDITIENPRGSTRSGVDADGNTWEITLNNTYGYFKRSQGKDGDQIDVFLGDNLESERVFIVDQVDQDGNFDEHKVMLGFDDQQQASENYLANYEEGWQGLGEITELHIDAFKEWVKDGKRKRKPAAEYKKFQEETTPAIKQPPQTERMAADVLRPETRIDDFGEKIEGARKDIAKTINEQLQVTEKDMLDQPLSKVLPPINYQELVETGMATVDEAALLHFVRKEIGPKPRKSYKEKRWLTGVKMYQEFLKNITEKEAFVERYGKPIIEIAKEKLPAHTVSSLELHTQVLKELGFPNQEVNLAPYEVKKFEGKLWKDGKELEGTRYTVVKGQYIIQDFTTLEAAAAGLKYILENKKANTGIKFDAWTETGKKGVFIGKKVGPGKFITLAEGFETAKEARNYIKNNQQDLENKLEQAKFIPESRPQAIEERSGTNQRGDKNITPDEFSRTFGFRGVQFGEYVEQSRRQADLNNTYDALMDLADVLGVTPRALSLAGELGIAFGARGKGGKRAPTAHYEPGQIVINITKRAGPGSLAHEWWHAMDNYFERMRGSNNKMITERPFQIHREGQPDTTVRTEVLEAIKGVTKAIKDSGIEDRSRRLDVKRTKDYWSEMTEMSARAFESYVQESLQDKGIKNDYLVAFTDMVEFILDAGEDFEQQYPYPTKEESPAINKAFEKLFKTLKVKQEGDTHVLFKATPSRYVRADRQAADILTERPTYEPKGNTAILNKAIQGAELQTALKDARDIDPTAYLSTRESGIVFASQELTHQFINQQNEKQGLPTQDFEVTKTVTEKPAQNLSQAQRQRVNELTKEYEGQIEESESNLTIAKDRLKKKRAEFSTAMQTQMFDTDKQVSMFDTQADPKAVDAALKPYTDAVEFYEKQAKKLKDNKDKTTERIIKEQQGQTEVKFRMHGREIVDHDQKEAWTQSDVEKAVNQTVDRFGLTEDINEAGWILTDGRMVDHSGKADGLTPGTRNYNSYKVGETLRGIDLKNFKPTVLIVDGHAHRMSAYGEMAFLDMDNIAVTNEGIKIKHQPTSQQLDVIREYAEGREQITMNIKGYQVTVPASQAVDYIQRRFQDTERPVYGHYSISPARIYQNVDYALKSTKMEKGTKEQWRAELTKLGAKQYELEWKGFDELPAHMERSEIEQWAKDSRVEVEVVRKEDNPLTKEDQIRNDELREHDQALMALSEETDSLKYARDVTTIKGSEQYNKINKELEVVEKQYKDYVSKNIGEILKSQGHKEDVFNYANYYFHSIVINDQIRIIQEGDGVKYAKYTTPGGKNYQEVLLTLPGVESEFKTQHWAEPNVVVSIRHKDFQGDDGRRILMVEEMQSDWAQKGRKIGFKELSDSEYAKLDERRIELERQGLELKKQGEEISESAKQEWVDIMNKMQPERRAGMIPAMPFQKTDQWVGLAWKHILEYAVDNGYDGVALTKGEQQAERYDLSKQIIEVRTTKLDNENYDVLVIDNDRKGVNLGELSENQLANNIGKELAEKIIADSETKKQNKYSGIDLKIGGEGMKAFYDNIAPKWINKNLKKHGIRVSEYDLGTQIDQETGDITNPVKVHYFPLNESLYEQVSKEGMPMFALEGKTAKNHPKVKKVIDELTQRAPNAQDSAVIAYQKDLVSEMKANGESDVVIQSVLKKIKEGGTINAFVSPGTGRAYFISENMPSDTGSIIKTWIHEQGIHAGLESLIPDSKQRNRLLETVFDNVGEDGFKEMMGETYKYYKDETKATKGNEYLARLSEKMDAGQLLTPAEKTAWQKIKDFINNLISQVFNRHIKLSDNELRDIVRASVQSMVQGLEVESKTGRTQEGIQTSINFKIDGKRVSEPIDPGWWAKLTRGIQDRMKPVKRLQDEIIKRGGRVPEYVNVYDYENAGKSRKKFQIEEFMENEWNSLMRERINLHKSGMSDRDIHLYSIAKGAQDRNFHLKMTRDVEHGSGLSDREAGVIVQIFEHGITKDEAIFLLEGEIGPAHNDVVEFVKNTEFYGKEKLTKDNIEAYWNAKETVTDYTLNKGVETGLISRETSLEWKKQYGKYYVPLRGWDGQTSDDIFSYIERDRGQGSSSPLHVKAKGRASLPEDPTPHMGNIAHSTVVVGDNNLIKKRLFHLAELNPEMKDMLYAEIVYNVFDGADWKETTVRPSQELWDRGWVRMDRNEQHTYRMPRQLSEQQELQVFINGEKKIVVASDPLIIRPFKQPSHFATEAFTKGIWARYTRALSRWHTRKNPAFILPNLVRDVQFGAIYHWIEKDKNYLYSYLKNYPQAHKATIRAVNNKSDLSKEADKYYREWYEHGGPTGFVHMWEIKDFQRQITKDVEEIKKNKLDHVNLFKAEGRLTERLAKWSEDVPRFNTYMTSRRLGKSILQSVKDSKESSVNFDRKGYGTGIMSSLWVFANSRIQGIERLGRVWRNNSKKVLGLSAMLMAKGFMESYMYDTIAGEDEEGIPEYDKMSEYIRGRYSFYSIPGTGKVVTIPGPHGWRAFSGLGSIAYDVFTGRKTMQEAMPWAADFLSEAFTPVDMGGFLAKDSETVRPYRLLPTATLLPMELALDQTFTGRGITRQPFTAAQDYIPHSQRHHDFVNKTIKSFTDTWFEIGGGDRDVANRNYYKDGKHRTVPRMFDINPAYVEHIASNVFGGKGYFYKQMWGMAENTVEFAKEILDEERKEGLWETAREMYHTDDIPVTSRFLRQPRRDPLEGWYWDKRREDQSFLQTERIYKDHMDFYKVKMMRDDPAYAEMVANVEIIHETIDNLRRQEQKLRAFEEGEIISFRDLEGKTHEMELQIPAEEQIELIEKVRRELMMGTVEDKIKDPKKVFDKIYEQIKSMR